MTKGGKRIGAGRPKGSANKIQKEPTIALPRVPQSKYQACFNAILKILKIK